MAAPRSRVVHPQSAGTGQILVDITASHVLNKFSPNQALGGSVDAIGVGSLTSLFSNSNTASMVGSGLGSISYRLYTELNVQDWHWNPAGTWSDAANSQGYFIGNSTPQTTITDSYGFQLAHRGNTKDQGDNMDYSRLSDGDASTYWKSNPYLTSTYTHESDSLHPQWVVVDLGSAKSINAIQIQWVNPYAIAYTVQYWTGGDAMNAPTSGKWVTFPAGTISNGSGGTVALSLSSSNVSARCVRVLMSQSSMTFDSHGSADPRNKMGYAIAEIGVGTVNSSGVFTDLMTHAKGKTQTKTYVSSTDPWHTSKDQNTQTEQIGLDFIFKNPLSQGLPMIVPVPMVYSTPENAVAEVAYLNQRHYPILGIELGEEPDGQFMTPEDYGAFYVQWATTIQAAFPSQKLGGPVLSGSIAQAWADASGETDWMKRFITYLSSHSALPQLGFVSVEHYPNYLATENWSLLLAEPSNVQAFFANLVAAQVPKGVPVYITEYNFDSAPEVVMVDLMGALWQAIFVGEFLNRGGQAAFYYQYFPWPLQASNGTWGLLGMFAANATNQVGTTTAQYHSNGLINLQWCIPGAGQHSVFPASCNVKDSKGNVVVLPYAVYRPDGSYSVLIVNTDTADHDVTVEFAGSSTMAFNGLTAQYWLSPSNYVWNPNGANGTASPSGPINALVRNTTGASTYHLPAHSITVVAGKIH